MLSNMTTYRKRSRIAMPETRKTRPISWLKSALKEFQDFPEAARSICLNALTIAAEGAKADIAKPLRGMGSGVFEIALRFRGDAFRVVYTVQLGGGNLGGPCFPEEIDAGHQDAQAGDRPDKEPSEKS